MKLKDLITPALLLDLDMFDANLRHMASAVKAAGKKLRPHAKAHKCVEIARRQVAAGAVGVCAATVHEVAWMAKAGIPGILLTCPVASWAKVESVVVLAGQAHDLMVVVDHPMQVELWQRGAKMANWNLQVLVDLDVGDHRTGIPCDERAVALAQAVDAASNLELRGVQAYSVSGSHTDGFEARKQHSLKSLAPAVEIFGEMRRRGLPVEIFSGGSTGTWNIDLAIPEFTELQSGSYVGMDIAYRRIGVTEFAPALSVLATVISGNHDQRVTLDAGFKAFSTDRPFGPEVRGFEGVRYQWAGDEHGFLLGDSGLKVGDQVQLDAPHCDPTFNLYDRVYACRGDSVEAVWPLKGNATISA